ncbi:hypothetical protein L1987_47082 [Smallanthus sonchifolius]|uniref:Uncharacterized protein n=1 Tax=Smallanthus sonchifolius TaxID=185202 RepID=A0ACB9G271_9ASTR|nr:hypothetical protein L1987_47082 [Smallanthus sonchifolius]
MVTEDELIDDEDYEDIFEDMKMECGKFGEMVGVWGLLLQAGVLKLMLFGSTPSLTVVALFRIEDGCTVVLTTQASTKVKGSHLLLDFRFYFYRSSYVWHVHYQIDVWIVAWFVLGSVVEHFLPLFCIFYPKIETR